MMTSEKFYMHGTMEDYEEWNRECSGEWALSEMKSLDLNVMKKWIDIRDKYTFLDKYDDERESNWKCIDIKPGNHTKYGTNYIFVDDERMLCRVCTTASEFYGSLPPRMCL